MAGHGAGKFAAGGVCQVCYGTGSCQVYEFLFVHHEELEEYPDDGFSYSVPDDAYYLAAGDWLRVGIYCFLFGAVSGGDAGCGPVFRVVCGSLLCGRLRFDQVFIADTPTPIGEFAVLSMVLLSAAGMVWVYKKKWEPVRNILLVTIGVLLIAYFISEYVTPFNLVWVQWGLCILVVGYLIFLSLSERHLSYFLIGMFAIGSIGFLYSSDYFFNKVLEPHQQIRIKVVLGMEEDLAGAGYNVNQSKIAIGSGGLTGKGFLNGTQTKLKYVPEQDTDFIFCTVGEEEGFIGSTAVLLLFLILILRLIAVAERQPSTFGRVYGYSVVSIFLFHLFINVGMVLGLTPVIGIPLPFFSYGGSSLWGFTILLFIFLRIDAGRKKRLSAF